MSGIPLWIGQYGGSLVNPRTDVRITHIARPVPEDEAREAVIAAARSLQESASSREAEATYESICRALDRLDALDAS